MDRKHATKKNEPVMDRAAINLKPNHVPPSDNITWLPTIPILYACNVVHVHCTCTCTMRSFRYTPYHFLRNVLGPPKRCSRDFLGIHEVHDVYNIFIEPTTGSLKKNRVSTIKHVFTFGSCCESDSTSLSLLPHPFRLVHDGRSWNSPVFRCAAMPSVVSMGGSVLLHGEETFEFAFGLS